MYIRIKKSPICFHKTDGQNIFFDSRKIHEFFLDDIIIYSTTFEEHIGHIEQVMIRLQNAQLTAKPVKTFLCKKTVQYLGFMINKNELTTTEENIEKIKNYPIPKTEAILD